MRRLFDFPRAYLISGVCITVILSAFWISAVPQRPQLSPSFPRGHGAGDSSLDSVLNETLGFQKIFVLNLQRSTDRRDLASLAAAFAGLKLDFIDGVTEFDMNARPVRFADRIYQDYNNKTYNSWRAHVNAIRTVVEQNLASALIMEDDADFDISIKTQMRDFARATRLLLQPIQGTNRSIDPTNPRKSMNDQPFNIDFDNPGHTVTEPTSSPYGDVALWDILWLGHCGSNPGEAKYPHHPLGRVLQKDPTAIQTQHYTPFYGDRRVWPAMPNNTRLVFHAHSPVCNLAYAISNQSARKLLYQLGIQNMTGFSDSTLHKICNGDRIPKSEYGYKKRNCMSVLPPLFGHHFPLAYPRAFTENIRYPMRGNFEELVDGETDYFDAFPNDKPMELYFHHVAAKARWEEYLREPERLRREEAVRRGIDKAQVKLKLEQQQREQKQQGMRKIPEPELEPEEEEEPEEQEPEEEEVGEDESEDISK